LDLENYIPSSLGKGQGEGDTGTALVVVEVEVEVDHTEEEEEEEEEEEKGGTRKKEPEFVWASFPVVLGLWVFDSRNIFYTIESTSEDPIG
jgi:hypothetical protein